MTRFTPNRDATPDKVSYLGLWLAMTMASFTVACTSTPLASPNVDPLNVDLHARGIEPDQVIRPFTVTAEMRDWARQVTRGGRDPESRLLRLQDALVRPDKLAMRYQKNYTGTAVEAFRRKEANCLAFAHLFVGLARAVGLPAYFVAVRDTRTYGKTSDLSVATDHVVVAHGIVWRRQIIDFDENPVDNPRRYQPISDLTAIAMFYSNRGAEILQVSTPEEAIHWLEMAVRLDPDLSNAWVNLGVARRRLGNAAGAEDAYRRSLASDPTMRSAFRNLEFLLRRQGRISEVEQMLAQRRR